MLLACLSGSLIIFKVSDVNQSLYFYIAMLIVIYLTFCAFLPGSVGLSDIPAIVVVLPIISGVSVISRVPRSFIFNLVDQIPDFISDFHSHFSN